MKRLLGLLHKYGSEFTGPVVVLAIIVGGYTLLERRSKTPRVELRDTPNVAALKRLRAKIRTNHQGDVIEVNLMLRAITDADLKHLRGMAKLEHLYLNGTPITDVGMKHIRPLVNLRVLGLNVTQITDAGLVHLKGLPKLTHLLLSGTQITDAGLAHLKELISLKELALVRTQITETCLLYTSDAADE